MADQAQTLRFFLAITGPDLEERRPLELGATHAGRRPDNELVLNHPFVSGRHLRLDCTETGCTLTDLESTNGTTVDGEDAPPGMALPLNDGAVIVVGPFTLRLEAIAVMVPETPAPEPVPEPAEPVAPEPERKAAEQEAPQVRRRVRQVAPPAAPPANGQGIAFDPAEPPPGLTLRSERLLDYLPGIYHTDFVARFLGIFESILVPVEWTVDNFDLFLSAGTAPAAFLPWLANWYTISFDATWSEAQRRALLAAAPAIYARRGTRWALARVLEIYTGAEPEIVEFDDEADPFTFAVRFPFARGETDETLLQQIVDASKPAHTNYRLQFAGERPVEK
jgi:phage tail-like protein